VHALDSVDVGELLALAMGVFHRGPAKVWAIPDQLGCVGDLPLVFGGHRAFGSDWGGSGSPWIALG
jgi:hypothetical protein